jgi:hypothetical protein
MTTETEIPAGHAVIQLNRLFATEADAHEFVSNNMTDSKIVKTWRTEAVLCEVLTPIQVKPQKTGKNRS